MSEFDRGRALERLEAKTYDVVVIGGGMTGCGIAVDAASRGLSVALVEKDDFASGTSSKSSKMVHGGLRYLQQREYRLVYENLHERQRLLDNAPHLISPLPFLIPLFGKDGVVSKTVARSYATALWLYDLTGGVRIGHKHRRITKDETLSHLPSLKVERLVAGFLYYDARGDDARVALALARTATDLGADCVNYCAVTGYSTHPTGKINGVIVQPGGPSDASRAPLTIKANVVINAAGVWADEVRKLEETETSSTLAPAKGIHISVPYDRLPCDIASVIPVPKDKRSIFVVPWKEAGFVYLGTTDTAYDGPLDHPRSSEEDVAYLLNAVNAVTRANLSTDDVTGVWAGLRPLLHPDDGAKVSKRTADLSRRHKVTFTDHGVVTVTGGKWTTYRKMAQDTVDLALEQLGRSVRCKTAKLALHGAPGSKTTGLAGITGVDREIATVLWGRYGTDATAVVARAGEDNKLLRPLVDGLPYLRVEVLWAVESEMAQTLEDVLSRRTRASIQDVYAAMDAAPRAAKLMAPLLGWSEETTRAQVLSFTATVQGELEAAGLSPTRPASQKTITIKKG